MSDRLELYYGPPGSAKSSAVAAVIAKLYQETGKKARVLIGDGSAATYADAGLTDAGIVQLFDYTTRNWPISTMEQLAEGYWPADPLDPKSPMVAPTVDSMKDIILTAIEGVSMVANYIMGDKKGGLAERAGRGEKIGQDSPIQITDADLDAAGRPIKGTGSGRSYGGNPPSHYNVAQKRLQAIIERSKMLPGWVIWTAHERSATNKLTNTTVIGPEGAGEADTPRMSRSFNNTLRFATAEKATKETDPHTGKSVTVLDTVYRIYTRTHYKAEGTVHTPCLATTRIKHPEMMPLYLEGPEGESILKFYDIIAVSRAKAVAAIEAGMRKEAA